ncbi:class IIb bacteriocin, lactobin A/cerein 7B family [Flavobacterium resistens]|uniref:Class IIb bacteriocin, lactobin A/cerein 7B family n=1 Tax=Flavobacterium resistens TaxID=443612 RepID=A0A521C4N4_9FLAO|nr:class IIb bacteriocin, lactobin A/cerein 7B family [Flavobacterium resistens]MRX69592.1 class IIb bacteriocin, lactobin A/cerein 7B family [Flavobacterium resistens]SMO54368.1 class IIb bacteriocin, lactobin A/cerein 7B family [Flavobacterium resistens]
MNLENLNVVELNSSEVEEIEGGFLPLLVVGACLLLGGCAAYKPTVDPAQDR